MHIAPIPEAFQSRWCKSGPTAIATAGRSIDCARQFLVLSSGRGAHGIVMKIVEGHVAIERPANVECWDVDPYSDEYLLNPVESYRSLRSKGDFAYIPRYGVLATGHHRVISEILARSEVFVSSRGAGITDYGVQENWRKPSIILEVDPPYHTRTRSAMMHTLAAGVVNGLKPMFAAEADRFLDMALAAGSLDAIADLAETYSLGVFPRAVGLKSVDRRKIIDYGILTFNASGPDNARTREWRLRGADAVAWITESCRRDSLTPDGMGEALYKQADAGEITAEEAAMLVRAFLTAGMVATVAAVGIALWSLASNPEQFEALKKDPSLARAAFDEAIRLNAPVHHFYRTCIADTVINDVVVPENAKILLSYGAANLDPAKFEEPERYDIHRKASGVLTFGSGLHSCIGQMLARAEGEAIISAMARKVTTIELAGEAVWLPNNLMRMVASLPVSIR